MKEAKKPIKTKETIGKKFENFQVSNFVLLIEKQKETKELDEKTFFNNLLEEFVSNCENNKFYKKTPYVFKRLSIFYVQLGKAFKIAYPKLNYDSFKFCMWLYNNTIFCPAIYKTKYTAFDVDASEASRILKRLKVFN